MNVIKTTEELKEFIYGKVHEAGCDKVVLGVSGGKDSTVVAMLAVEALGKENVIAIIMPNDGQKDIEDAEEVCETLGIKYYIRDIGEAYNCYVKYDIELMVEGKERNPEALINVAPRLRMTMLYMYAAEFNALVIGTGNLCERKLGYFTKYGDGGCDLNPIGGLMVSEVIELGKYIAKKYGIRENLIDKIPSDGLSDKSDEEKLGVSYADVERVLTGRLDEVSQESVDKIEGMIKRSQHKRKMPPIYGLENITL